MTESFFYCFIRYQHSLRLGESLNVGLLIFFPSDNLIFFRYPENLQRLKCSYFDLQEEQLNIYLKSLKRKAEELSYNIIGSKNFNNDAFSDLINRELLPEDEGSIQVSQIRKGVKYSAEIETIVNDLYFSYFEYYYDPEEVPIKKKNLDFNRRDDQYILSTLQSLIVKQKPSLKEFDFSSRSIETDNISLTFDLEWEQQSQAFSQIHLVKPLSLDFKNVTTIQERAHSLHSKLHILEKELPTNQYRFDVVVAKPTLSKFELAYTKAISILRESSDKTQVIEEDQYSTYSKEIVKALST